MKIRKLGEQVRIEAPAKINLFLELHNKRADGFHELETVITAVSLYDSLQFEPRNDDQIKLVVRSDFSEETIPSDESNLVFKALDLARSTAGSQKLGANVWIRKRIPSQAGLGGGSSNAAAGLLAAQLVWNLGLTTTQLHSLATELGSDVPFFLSCGTAVCRGRGELVEPLDVPANRHIVIAKPPVGLPTAEVFSHCKLGHSTENWNDQNYTNTNKIPPLFNRLQQSASHLTDWISRLKSEFDRILCHGHQMSGSGSSCFGLFANSRMANRAAKSLSNRLPDVRIFCCKTIDRLSLAPLVPTG